MVRKHKKESFIANTDNNTFLFILYRKPKNSNATNIHIRSDSGRILNIAIRYIHIIYWVLLMLIRYTDVL